MRKLFIIVALLCSSTFAAEKKATPKVKKQTRVLSAADKIVQKAVDKIILFKGLRAQTTMRIIDKPAKFTLGVNTRTVAEAPSNVRIQASKLAGRIKAFDVGIYGDNIKFYLPRGKVMFVGTAQSLRENTDVSFYPDEIIGKLMRGNVGLLRRSWKIAKEQPKRGFTIIDEIHDPANAWRRLTIDMRRDRYWLTLVEYIDFDGTQIFNKVFDKHRALSEKIVKGGTGKVFPYWFKIDWPREQRSVAINFKRVEFNPELKKDDFEVHLYKPKQVRIKKIKEVAEDEEISKSLNETK